MPQHGAPRASTRPGPRRSSGHPEWFRSGARQPFRFTQWIDWASVPVRHRPSQSVNFCVADRVGTSAFKGSANHDGRRAQWDALAHCWFPTPPLSH